MLKLQILEEESVKMSAGQFDAIIVYLRLGRNHIDVLNGDLQVSLANGIDERNLRLCFDDEK